MRKFLPILLLAFLVGCSTPQGVKQMGLDHSLFRCYGWQQQNLCAPYSMGLALRLDLHGIDYRRLIFKTRDGYHSVIWFTVSGKEYIMDNESYSPTEVHGANLSEKLRMFSDNFIYIPNEREERGVGDPFYDKKHYKKVFDSFDKYKKSVYGTSSVKHDWRGDSHTTPIAWPCGSWESQDR